ncbi:hypothetical protein NE571_11660, partial [Bacteroides sp. SL.2.06]|uniref:hypothetical protein n=1 Tax=Bacteroides sp. SL.2.06 TaxID=2965272 RepID=UPI00210D31CB
IFNYPRFGRQTVFWGECLKIQKRQLTRNELVALNFIILGISLSMLRQIRKPAKLEISRLSYSSFFIYHSSFK